MDINRLRTELKLPSRLTAAEGEASCITSDGQSLYYQVTLTHTHTHTLNYTHTHTHSYTVHRDVHTHTVEYIHTFILYTHSMI